MFVPEDYFRQEKISVVITTSTEENSRVVFVLLKLISRLYGISWIVKTSKSMLMSHVV